MGLYHGGLIYALSPGYEYQQSISSLQLLTQTRPFLTTDPREKIYALLGIPTTDLGPDNGTPFMEPDYHGTTTDTYFDRAVSVIEKSQSLRILSYVQNEDLYLPRLASGKSTKEAALRPHDKTLIDVPSWDPRWHVCPVRIIAPPELSKTFGASGDFMVDQIRIEGRRLVTRGMHFSTVISKSRDLRP